jgi:hypothetical protein
MHKDSFIINRNTLLHVSTLLGHLQGELSVTVTLGLHFAIEWECAVDCVLRCFWRRVLSAARAGQKQRSTQSTAHSHSTVKCNPSVTVTENSAWRWPSRVETCRSVLRLMIKLSLCICWWLVFLYEGIYNINTSFNEYINQHKHLIQYKSRQVLKSFIFRHRCAIIRELFRMNDYKTNTLIYP